MQWAYAVISDPIPWLTMGLFMKASGTCAVFCSSTVNVCIVYAISSPTFLASIRFCFVSLVLPTGQTIRWDPCYAIYSLRFHSIRGNGDERSDRKPRSEVSLFGIDFPILTQQLDERGGNIQLIIIRFRPFPRLEASCERELIGENLLID